jgi:hypothetical protein
MSSGVISIIQMQDVDVLSFNLNISRPFKDGETIEASNYVSHDICLEDDTGEHRIACILFTFTAEFKGEDGNQIGSIEHTSAVRLRVLKEHMDEDTFMQQAERIGLSVLITSSRSSIRAAAGALGFKLNVRIPLLSPEMLINQRLEHVKSNSNVSSSQVN